MLTLALLLACDPAAPESDAAYEACLVAISAACDCWIESAGWSDEPYGPHIECVERKRVHCDDGSWTLDEINVFMTTMECTSVM